MIGEVGDIDGSIAIGLFLGFYGCLESVNVDRSL